MLNSGKKIRATKKKFNSCPPPPSPCKLNGRSLSVFVVDCILPLVSVFVVDCLLTLVSVFLVDC